MTNNRNYKTAARSNRKGVTQIELLIGIGILAIAVFVASIVLVAKHYDDKAVQVPISAEEPPKALPESKPVVSESTEEQIRKLKQKRLESQEKILQAITVYEECAATATEKYKSLKTSLGKTPYEEAAKQFRSGNVANIAKELRPAYHAWRAFVDEEKFCRAVRAWIDARHENGSLVDIEIKIAHLERITKMNGIWSDEDRKEVFTLLAQEIGDVKDITPAESLNYEAEIDQWLMKDLK